MSEHSRNVSVWSAPPGAWLSIVALLGFAWNLFGALQFVRSLTATEVGLIASGMTPEQASVMTGFPAWVTLVFGIGVVTSLLGCGLLFMRQRAACPTLGISFLAFVVLWIAYAAYGAYAALGTPQIVIMSVVVAGAAALFVLARRVRPARNAA